MGRLSDNKDLGPRGRLGIGGDTEVERRKRREEEAGGGRRAIIVLFLLTVGLSLFFWLQGKAVDWLGSFFGPSTWTFSR
jgi:hypothetical protein